MRKSVSTFFCLLFCPLLVAQQASTPAPAVTTPNSAPAATTIPQSSQADVTFGNVKLADPKGKLADGKLVFSDTTKSVVIRVADRDVATISYASIDKLSYEYTKKHRITSGAIVMVFSLGAGAIVMLTKSKSNWFYIDYHDKDSKELIVLRLEKKDLQTIFQAAKDHTGKEVIDLGDAGKG